MIPKPPKPPPAPKTPVLADTASYDSSAEMRNSRQSLVTTSPKGLTRKAETVKRSLLGGTA